MVSMVVDEKGIPRDLKVVRRTVPDKWSTLFDEAAIRSVAFWHFSPATKGGQPVAVRSTVEVSFHVGAGVITHSAVGAKAATTLAPLRESEAGITPEEELEDSYGSPQLLAGSEILKAPGRGHHSYSSTLLDSSRFRFGGTFYLRFSIGDGKAEASFDIFFDNARRILKAFRAFASQSFMIGMPPNTTGTRVYRFDRGQSFLLGFEGSWNSSKDSSNSYKFGGRVFENTDSLIARGCAKPMENDDDAERDQRSDNTITSRVVLVARYGCNAATATDVIRADRSLNILWLIKNRPRSEALERIGFFTFNTRGDPLADENAYREGRVLWLKQIERQPSDTHITIHATKYLALYDPEESERLLMSLVQKDRRYLSWLGELYGLAILGVTTRDYKTGEPISADEKGSQSEFAKRALATLESSSDMSFVRAAASIIEEQGRKLRDSGKIAWDYQVIVVRLAHIERNGKE